MPNNYSDVLAHTLHQEGGVNLNETGDRGISNRGVTQSTYDAYRKRKGLETQSVKNMTVTETSNLYYEDFYTAPGFNTLPSKIGGELFDFGINSGTGTAIKTLQGIVGADVDGIIGPQTKQAVNQYVATYGENTLALTVLNARQSKLQKLATDNPKEYGRVINGWNNRLNSRRSKYTSPLGAGGAGYGIDR